jgi:hypothetical protein
LVYEIIVATSEIIVELLGHGLAPLLGLRAAGEEGALLQLLATGLVDGVVFLVA